MAKRKRRSFGAVRKLPSGRFQSSYISPEGLRQSAAGTFATRTDADGYLNSVRYEIDKGLWALEQKNESAQERILFGDFALSHIAKQTTSRGALLKPSTKSHYKKLLRVNLKDFLEIPIWDITKPMVDEWYLIAISEGRFSTASKAYKLLSGVCKRAVLDDVIIKNPCAVRGAQSASTGKKIVCPTPEQVNLLARQIAPKYRMMVLVSAYAGLRFGEVTQLRVKDFHLLKRGGPRSYSIRVERAVICPTFSGQFLCKYPRDTEKEMRCLKHIRKSFGNVPLIWC